MCNGNHIRLLSAHKPIVGEASVIGRKGTLMGKAGNLGRRWTHVLTPTPKILFSLDTF